MVVKHWVTDILCKLSHTGFMIAYKLGIAEEGKHICTVGQERGKKYGKQ